MNIRCDFDGERALSLNETVDGYIVIFQLHKWQRRVSMISWEYTSFDEAMAWFDAVIRRLHDGNEPGTSMPGWMKGRVPQELQP